SANRPLAVIFTWLVLLALAAGAFLTFGGTLVSTVDIPGTPTSQTTDRLEEEFPDAARGTGNVVFQTEDGTALTDDQRESIKAVLEDTRNVEGVDDVIDPFATDADLADQQQELVDGRDELAAARDQLDDAPAQLDAAEAELESSGEDLDAAQEQLDAAVEQAVAAGMPEATAQEQFATQQRQLDAARADLEDG